MLALLAERRAAAQENARSPSPGDVLVSSWSLERFNSSLQRMKQTDEDSYDVMPAMARLVVLGAVTAGAAVQQRVVDETSLSCTTALLLGALQLSLCYALGWHAAFFLRSTVEREGPIGSRIFSMFSPGRVYILAALHSFLPRLAGLSLCLTCFLLEKQGVSSSYLAAGRIWPHAYSRNAVFKALLLYDIACMLQALQAVLELDITSQILRGQEQDLWQNAFERRVLKQLMSAYSNSGSAKSAKRNKHRPVDTFERASAELITTGHPSAKLWQKLSAGLTKTTEREDRYTCSKRGVERGARLLFRGFAASGHMRYEVLEKALHLNSDAERFWLLLRRAMATGSAAGTFARARSKANLKDNESYVP